eukprot:SAG11_NODE_9713_length_887_cov_0.883249_1_plen_56_part_10
MRRRCLQVIKAVVHLSAAGATAAWYFETGERRAALAALRRALTTSFGTVCFGALVT